MPEKNHKLQPAFISIVLALLTLAVYWRVKDCDFIRLDDYNYVVGNTNVQAGLPWAGVKWAFTSFVSENWHPLTWLSLMLDCQLFGLKPGPHHLVNLLFHIANTLLLFAWLRKLTGTTSRSAMVAALFAWHPLHVESVAWIAERKDVLSTFFWMLTLLAYQNFKTREQRQKTWYALALIFFVLGLLAKPMLVTLPCVLLLVDWWNAQTAATKPFLAMPWKKWLAEKIPFFALAAASCVITFIAQNKGGAVEKLTVHPLSQRLANATVSYARYLGKMFCPTDLVIYYPHPGEWDVLQVFGALFVLLAITFLALKFRRNRPWLPVGWFWFLGTLVPVIGILQVGRQAMADRYSYVPLIGVFIIIVWAVNEWAERTRNRIVAIGAAIAVLIACMGATWNLLGYWKNTETLFKRDIEVAGNNYLANYCLATFYLANDVPDEAVAQFDLAFADSPADEPHAAPILAIAQSSLGSQLQRQGKLDDAAKYFAKAVATEPANAQWHLDLARALLKQTKTNDALAELNRAAQLDPKNIEIQNQLATVYAHQRDETAAVSHYREAERLYRGLLKEQPDSAALLNNLAWMLATNPCDQIRDGTEAVSLARRACEATQWKQPVLIGTLAAACAEAGKFDEAVEMGRKARDTAISAGQNDIAGRNQDLLKLYEARKPYRDDGD